MAKVKVKGRAKGKKLVQRARNATVKAFNPYAREYARLIDKATEGWSGKNKPTVTPEIRFQKSIRKPLELRIKIEAAKARGSKSGKTVFELLDEGTKVRRAVVGPKPYKSKTKPGKLGNFGTGGKALKVDKNLNLPGIEARRFTETINAIIDERVGKRLPEVYFEALFG